jgi:hypothetical protein
VCHDRADAPDVADVIERIGIEQDKVTFRDGRVPDGRLGRMQKRTIRTVTLEVASRKDVSRRALKPFSGKRQRARISFATPELLWKVLMAKRWEVLKAMASQGRFRDTSSIKPRQEERRITSLRSTFRHHTGANEPFGLSSTNSSRILPSSLTNRSVFFSALNESGRRN